MNTGRNSEQPATGGRGTLSAQRIGFNTLDNWGHKAPTQSKRKRTRKKRLKGHGPEHVYNTLGYICFVFFILDRDISVEILLWFKKVYILLMSMSRLLLVNTFVFFFAACSYHQQSFAQFFFSMFLLFS